MDARVPRVCVLLDVHERLGDDEVRGHLDRDGEALAQPDVERHRDAARRDERRERGVEAAVGEYRGRDPGDESPEVCDRRPRLGVRGLDQLARRLGVAVELLARATEVHRHRHHPRLRPVMEVALDPP